MSSKPSSETLSIYLGTPSLGLAVSSWELLLVEHGLKPDGTPQSITEESFSKMKDPGSFFTSTKAGKHVPKALLMDLDPSPIFDLKQGVYRSLFESENLIAGNHSAGLYSIGYETGKGYMEKILEKIRKMAENCDRLETVMIYGGVGGGTGAGVGSLLLEGLEEWYERVDRIGVYQFPNQNQTPSHHFQSYNMGFWFMKSLELLDICIPYTNSTLYSICQRNFKAPFYHSSINRIMAQFLSGITAPNRLEGALAIMLGELRNTLIPDQKLKFLLPGLGPFTAAELVAEKKHSVYEITEEAVKRTGLSGCDMSLGNIIAGNLYYRGDLPVKDIESVLKELEKTLSFSPLSSRSLSISLSYFPNFYVPGGDMGRYSRSCSSLVNGTGVVSFLQAFKEQYRETIKGKGFERWVRYHDEGLELMGGDLGKGLKEIEEVIGCYEGTDTEIIEEL